MGIIDELIDNKILKTLTIINAFNEVKREDFVRDEFFDKAEENYPLPIGFNQTISQPLTVAFMLELLQPKEGHKILDIGSGSGYTTALLSHIVGQRGKVYGVEYIKELKKFGEDNIKKYSYIKSGVTKMFCGDGTKGLKEEAPYDRILVSAMAGEVPNELKKQLKVKGKLVIPYEEGVSLFIKKPDNTFYVKKYPGFIFVPLVNSWDL
jgi:protein-L-isoaspartate(D-aspartate) O-methyltransferase